MLVDLPMTSIDIGARGGFTEDLLPIAAAVDAVGFEPDPTECAALNSRAAEGPWRSLRYIPLALAEHPGRRTLHITRHAGASSFFSGDPDRAVRFSRSDYVTRVRSIELETATLDAAAAEYGLENAVFLKIDVEGAELEIFRSAARLLRGPMLAIHCEVSFFSLRPMQPLYADVDAYLRGFGFVPMGFEKMHHWRRRTTVKHPTPVRAPIPYSRGQIAHGDIVFFRDPESMPAETPDDVAALLRAAVFALLYEYVDHAAAIVARPAVDRYLRERYRMDPMRELDTVSRYLLRRHRERQSSARWTAAKEWVARRLRRS